MPPEIRYELLPLFTTFFKKFIFFKDNLFFGDIYMTALLDGPLKNIAKFDQAKRGLLIEAMTVNINID